MARLDTIGEKHPDIAQSARAEAEAVQRATLLQERLDQLESVFGEATSVPLETQKLMDTLRERDKALQSLQLQQKDSEAVCYAFICVPGVSF